MARSLVLGADGWLGHILAQHLSADRVVFRQPGRDETAFAAWLEKPGSHEFVINATGWRVRPGLQKADYDDSHITVTRQIVGQLAPGTKFIHLSSASVFGAGNRPGGPADPDSFPAADYARAKLSAEQIVRDIARDRQFATVILRPGIVYSPEGGGMIGTLLQLARRGVLLDVQPAAAVHHLCADSLLTAAFDRILQDFPLASAQPFVTVADPFTLTNQEICRDISEAFPHLKSPLPLPALFLGNLLRLLPRLKHPRLDLKTWGEILAIWALDSVYDTSFLWQTLMPDAAPFQKDKRWKETIRADRVVS